MDDFLKERLDNYNEWLDHGQIDYSAKIVPVRESLEDRQWVLPTEQVLEIIKEVDTIALNDCLCRSHYQRCDNPVDICLLLGQYGRKFIDKGLAREVTFEEAVQVLRKANEKGLVHLSLYRPDHQLYALCSCCSCCCHDLQLLLKFEQKRIVMHSDFIAETDLDECIGCGVCEERCHFGARVIVDGELAFNEKECYGCGLCVTTCPTEAIVMKRIGES